MQQPALKNKLRRACNVVTPKKCRVQTRKVARSADPPADYRQKSQATVGFLLRVVDTLIGFQSGGYGHSQWFRLAFDPWHRDSG